ncbi:MAG: transcription-repair coupling factor [Patescibacteria group bacterium]
MPAQGDERAAVPEPFKIVPQLLKKGIKLPVTGLPTIAIQAYFIASTQSLQKRVVFWLIRDEDTRSAEAALRYWYRTMKIQQPVWKLHRVTPLNAARLSKRIPQTVIATFSSLSEKFPSLSGISEHEIQIASNDRSTPAELSQKLVRFGYDFSSHASEPGYFARRGGVLDVYPVNEEQPVKIEFSDNAISKINRFNPVTKRSTGEVAACTVIAKSFIRTNTRTTLFGYLECIGNPIILYHDTEEINSILPDWQHIEQKLDPYEVITIRDFSKKVHDFSFQAAPLYRNRLNNLAADLKQYAKKNWTIHIATDKASSIQQLLKEKKLPLSDFSLLPFGNEISGFINDAAKILFLTDKEIFGEEQSKQEVPRRRVDQAFIMGLRPGDYVVHLDHGIGKFTGMEKHTIEGVAKEYFSIQYAEGDKLSVPVETADKISKYIGMAHPKLHRLSGSHWYQLTRKVKQEAKILAQELLKIYAKREMVKVKPFSKSTPEEQELSKAFPYDETPDQERAITDVATDLERETPMDRLICGDVGFGKTEVAVRAAFKAVMNKKQVALLAPTTILTQQHFDTFKARLKKFPVKVGILSRFETEKEQKDTIEKLKSGLIDIVIGTHRLLSADVNFKNLGLIIIDEEQRFGVKAKEKLKAFRTQTHILTLTATPIPRTLNIALSGVRDVSIIETPPEGRLPIETYIEQHADGLIKDAISRELKRNGQVYYLHNKVETISFAAETLKKLVPGGTFGIAHGRLPEKDLAQAMADFDTQKTNVLVCSTIIENGLDLPNVNTMIVDNATNFGLAQLYQLRGRIGRGERQAYAYFLYNRKKLKGNAKKRLEALMEAKKLGSGFQLALRDLEIRGAGNILGREQHGKVSAIGLSLYTRLLAQAIEELKFGKVQEPIRDILLDLPLESFIPPEFLPEEERLILYQKMAGITRLEDLHELKEKMFRSRTREEQRTFPQQLLNLFEVLEVRILAQKTDISHIDTSLMTDEFGHKRRRLILKFLFPLKPENLARLLQKNTDWQFNDDSIKIDLDKLGDGWLEELKKVIKIFETKERS